MKKVFTLLIFTAFGLNTLLAKEIRSAEVLFEKKCAMCHTVLKPKNKIAKKRMVAPPITKAMKSVVITIDALEGPLKDDELKKETLVFLQDYIYHPSAKKADCEGSVIKKFGVMPSLKGFISQKELDVLLPWVYENFKPKKVNGEWP